MNRLFDTSEIEPKFFEFLDEQGPEPEGGLPLDEGEEMEFAARLLEITDEVELDQFLESVFRRAGGVAQKLKRPLGTVLKKVASVGSPIVGTAAGTVLGGPLGRMSGGKLGAGAANLFGLELEGLSPEDQEFELARRFVRLAAASARNTRFLRGRRTPQAFARMAVKRAARRYAPGLVRRRRVPRPVPRRSRPRVPRIVRAPVFIEPIATEPEPAQPAEPMEPEPMEPALEPAEPEPEPTDSGPADDTGGDAQPPEDTEFHAPRRSGTWMRRGPVIILNV